MGVSLSFSGGRAGKKPSEGWEDDGLTSAVIEVIFDRGYRWHFRFHRTWSYLQALGSVINWYQNIEVIEAINSIFKLHRATPLETKTLEAPKPR